MNWWASSIWERPTATSSGPMVIQKRMFPGRDGRGRSRGRWWRWLTPVAARHLTSIMQVTKSEPMSVAIAAAAQTPPARILRAPRRCCTGRSCRHLLRLAWPNVLVMLAQAFDRADRDLRSSRVSAPTRSRAAERVDLPRLHDDGRCCRPARWAAASRRRSPARSAAGRRDDADALVLHALVINLALGAGLLRADAGVRAGRCIARSAARAARSRRRCSIPTSCSPASRWSG